jgi:hypothetical protein
MPRPRANSRWAEYLVAYYGIVEALHLVALLRAGVIWLRQGAIGYPSPPPPSGWSPQAQAFLIGTAVLDALNIGIAWLFAYGYFTKASWRWWVGGITLTAAHYSALVFAGGTGASGAWQAHPLAYLSLVILFAPVGILGGCYLLWGATGQFRDRSEKES